MDGQKKQKLLIGAVALATLGAGGYWYAGRDSGGDGSVAVAVGTGERKKRTKDVDSGRKTERKARAARKTSKPVFKRKERSEVDRKTSSRKKRTRRDRKKVKKESMVPAA